MRIAFLHTDHKSVEINNLISDIFLSVSENDFDCVEYNCLFGKDKNFIKEIFRFYKFLKNNKIDVVHTYSYIDAYIALKLCKRLNIRVVFSNYFYHDELKGFKKKIFHNVVKNTTMIFQTETQKKHYLSKYQLDDNEHFKLFHAFNFERYDSYEFKSLRDEFFIEDLKYLIATLGDFSPEHDVLNIFKMVKKLRRSGRNFICLIAGDMLDEYDSYYDDCRYYYLIQGLDNYISYIGHRNDHSNILSQLDAFLYHSDNEAVALPVIEALISGANVIVNESEMIKELTFNGKYATLYKTKDEKDFAEKTRDVLNNLEDYRLISEVVKEECRNIFSIENHIFGLKNIYSKLFN